MWREKTEAVLSQGARSEITVKRVSLEGRMKNNGLSCAEVDNSNHVVGRQ